jgi:hypothetical protein
MSAGPCRTELELSRALSVGADDELTAHLASCAVCRAEWDGLASAIAHARDLPAAIPAASHREHVRTALLAASERHAAVRRPVRWAIPAVALAAAAAVVLHLVRTAPSTEPTPIVARGVVHPHPGATYVVSAPPDEIVALHDGTIDVHVEPLGPGQRFRVVVGHDEVEVRGTAFEVVAQRDHLIGVQVVHGRVEVRRAGEATMMLGAGEQWHAPVIAARSEPPPPPPIVPPPPPPIVPPPHPAPVLPAPLRTPAAAPEPAIVPAPAPPATTADEAAFVSAWNAMRRNDFARAASVFAHVLVLAPDGPFAEDASYWFAVATARIPQAATAITAFREFLDRYPRDPRAGEASAMLGWLLVEAGNRTEAGRRFEAATTDPNEGVRASARAGLDELARSTQPPP